MFIKSIAASLIVMQICFLHAQDDYPALKKSKVERQVMGESEFPEFFNPFDLDLSICNPIGLYPLGLGLVESQSDEKKETKSESFYDLWLKYGLDKVSPDSFALDERNRASISSLKANKEFREFTDSVLLYQGSDNAIVDFLGKKSNIAARGYISAGGMRILFNKHRLYYLIVKGFLI